MARKKILWLCSWYPDKMEPFNGDFIQRHAFAAALYNDIYVLHVAGDTSGQTKRKEEFITQSPGLTEHLIYYPAKTSFTGRLISHTTWLQLHRDTIRQYISKVGKPDLVHVHVPYKAGIAGGWMKRQFGIPYVVTEHWTIYQPQNKIPYEQQQSWLRSVIKKTIRNSNVLLPVSHDLGDLINKQVTEKSFMVVENVANENYFFYTGRKEPGTAFRFLHVSNMTYQKNAEAIVGCFLAFHQQHPSAELVIAGLVSPSMKDLISKTGLLNTSILLRGEISYTGVAIEMQQADALVMFSRFENSPCTIIEALCCGLPVIASRVGGIPELVDESNGILVEPLDETALLQALGTMILRYEQFDREAIAGKAAARFSYPVIGKKLDEVYNAVSAKQDQPFS